MEIRILRGHEVSQAVHLIRDVFFKDIANVCLLIKHINIKALVHFYWNKLKN